MNHESYDEMRPEIERIMEDYLLLKRQGETPATDEFIRRYPSEHQPALREKIEEYEQMHLVFGAFAWHQASEFAPEEAQVNTAYEQFQERIQGQVLQIPGNREAIRMLCQRILTLIAPEEVLETVGDIERLMNMAARGQVEIFDGASLPGGWSNTDKMVSVIVPVVFSAVNQLLTELEQETLDAIKTENARQPIRKIKKRDIMPIVKQTKSPKGLRNRNLRRLVKALNNALEEHLET